MSRHSDESSVDAIDQLIDEGLREVAGGEAPPWLSARVRSRLENVERRRRGGFLAGSGRTLRLRLAWTGALAAVSVLLILLLRTQPGPSVGESVATSRPAASGGQSQGTGRPAIPGTLAAGPAQSETAPAVGATPGTAARTEAAAVSGKRAASRSARAARHGALGEEARRMGLARATEVDRAPASAIYVLVERPAGEEARQPGGIPPGPLEAQPMDVAALPAPPPLDIPALEVAPIAVTEMVIHPIEVKPIDPGGARAPGPGGTGNEESRKR